MAPERRAQLEAAGQDLTDGERLSELSNASVAGEFLSAASAPGQLTAFSAEQALTQAAATLFGVGSDFGGSSWLNSPAVTYGSGNQSSGDPWGNAFAGATDQIGDGNGIGPTLDAAKQFVNSPAPWTTTGFPTTQDGAGSNLDEGMKGSSYFGNDIGSSLQSVGKSTVGLFNFVPISAPRSTIAAPSPQLDQANRVTFAEADGERNSGSQNDITGSLGNGAGVLGTPSGGVAGVTALLSWGEPLGSSPSLEAPATTVAETVFTPAPPIPVRSSTSWYYNSVQGPPPADAFTGFPGGVDPFLVTPQGNPYGGTGSYIVGYYGDGTPAYRHVETPEEAFPNGVDPYLVAPIIQAPSNDDPMVYINVPGGTSYMEPYSEYYNNNFVNSDPSSADYIGPHYSPTYRSASHGNGYHGSDVYYSGSNYSGNYGGDSYYSDSYFYDSYFSDSYYSVGDSGGGDGGWGGGDSSEPVVLDLTGKGISITQLGSSNHYFSFGGNGLQEATAWAGAGNGVLAIDLNGTGNINQPDEINFTLWDPTAKSDMQALLDVFDTNHDGQLDAGDADWSKFGVIVTNADGTTQFKTLAQLGITAINLTSNNQTIVLPDGSSIAGSTTFTRSDGSTGTAADVTFAHDASGHLVETTTTVNADGSTTIDNKALNSSGSLANETISTTSADGKTVTISRDTAGNGVINSIQTDVTVDNADGSTTLTITNFDGTGSHVLNRTVSTTSAGLKTTSISRDHTGGGFYDQVETDARNAAGDLTLTLADYNPDGTLRDQTVTTTSADGLAKTTQVDSTGDGLNDRVQSDAIVVNADGSRTETVSDDNADGSLRRKTVTQTSADGQNKTIQIDNAGVGSFDTIETETIVRNADSSTTTTQLVSNADGSRRHGVVTTLSADGLSKTTQTDSTRDGAFDLVTTDVTVHNADGSTTETITDRNADSSLRDRSIQTWSADGKTRTVQTDSTGDGVYDTAETVAAGTAGASVDTVSHENADGSLKSRTVTTTSASGLSVTIQQDTTGALDGGGNAVFDQTRGDVTVLNANGSSTETVTLTCADGTLEGETVTTTSANGLSVTTQQDTTGALSGGNPVFDRTRTDVTVVNADGSQTETVTDGSTNGTMLDRTVSTISADRRTTTTQIDSTGDSYVSELRTRVLNADGSVTSTVKDFSANGTLDSESVTTSSANGLLVTAQRDTTGAVSGGNPVFDQTRTDVTVLNADGSRTETVTDTSANGTLLDQTVMTTSANGLSVTTQQDSTGALSGGNPVFDRVHSDVTVLNADGSRTETVTDAGGNGTLETETVTTTSANGLSVTTREDMTGALNGGNPVFDRTRTDVTALNADGSKTETVTDTSANGTILDRMVTTTSSDRRTTTVQIDSTGDNYFSEVRTKVVNADGSVTSTVKDFSANGTLESESVTTTSANGLSTTAQLDETGATSGGNPVFDQTRTDVTVLNADGSKAETVKDTSANGTLVDATVTTTSANGLTVTTQHDISGAMSAGNPVFDQTRIDVTVLNADGSKTETVTDTSANGTLLDRTITTTSADRRTITTQVDSIGDNYFSQVQTNVVNSDDSVTQTVKAISANGTLEAETVTTTSANGLSVTTQLDATGAVSGSNPVFDHVRTDVTVLTADGSKTKTATDTSASGAMLDQTVTTTSANGLSVTTQQDVTGATNAGNPVFDRTRTDVTVLNADGSKTETVADTSADGSMLDTTVTTTSANGLSVTTQQDVTGAVISGNPVFDLTRTDVTLLNADGSKAETVTDTSANGTLLDRTVTSVSADGRTTTVQIDATGDGYFSEIRSAVIDADGSTTLTVKDISADGTLESETVSTTSANGLSVTTQADLTGALSGGNPVFDLTRTDVTVLNADGSRTETVTDTNTNGTLVDETITTTSANGLSVTTQQDATGAVNGGAPVFDEIRADVTVLNADGSKSETVTDTSTDGTLLGRTVTTMSADGRTATIQIDPTGDNYFAEVRTRVVNADGNATLTVKDTSANGTLVTETVTTTSANGLSVTTQQDSTGATSGGNPVFDRTRTDVTVLNADGSKTETVTDTSNNGTLLDKMVTTTSANGLSVTTQQDSTGALSGGTPVFDQTRTDLKVLNADGSRTETVTDTSANGTLLDKTVTTTSANGLSVTTQQDTTGATSGGNPVFDRTSTDASVLNTDGSQTETVTITAGDGSLRSRTTTMTSANEKQVSISRDTNGDSVIDQIEVDTVAADGSKTRTISDYGAAGTLLDRAVITTSANGLSVTTRRDTAGVLDGGGNPVFDQIRTDVIVVNADGSKTETVTDTNAAGVLQDRAVVVTSTNGLSKTTEEDATGAGSFNMIEADVTVLNADGSTSETVTDTNSAGTLLRKTIATVSADGKTKTITRDLNVDGVNDQTGTLVTNADGSTVSTLSDFNANGTLKDKLVETTSPNGLSVTTQRDTTGSGSFDTTRTDVVVVNADGSRTETISNYNASSSLVDQTVKTVSANGLTTSTSWTTNLPSAATTTQSDAVVINADGSRTETLVMTGTSGAMTSERVLVTSVNGLSKTLEWDTTGATDGSGHAVFDQTLTDVTTVNADGSRVEVATARVDGGALMSKTTGTTSADGRTVTVAFDINGDGVVDRTKTTVTVHNADGSSVETVSDVDANGVLMDRSVTTISADGRTATATRDADGDGSTDQVQTTVTAIDGSQVDTITDLGRLGAVEDQSITTTSADGLTRTTQWDFIGSGKVDRSRTDIIVKNLDGSITETVTDLDSSGNPYQKAILTTSADGRTKTVNKQTPGQSYLDYNEVTMIALDGSSRTVAEYLMPNGTVFDQAITSVSADGLTETVQLDSRGSGTYDYTSTTHKNIDGSTVTSAVYLNATGQTIERIVTTVSPDGLVTTIDKDSTNAGWFDSIETIVARPDGSTVSTTRYLNSSGATTSELVKVTSADGNIVTQSVPPTISGTVAGQTTTSEQPVHPFSGASISDPNPGATDVLTITLSGAGGTLSGAGLSGSGNTYTLSGSILTINSELQALVFTPNAGQPNTSGTTTFRLSDASTGYTPQVLASFDGTTSLEPMGGLIQDAAGNLFGSTSRGGDGRGDVFVLPKVGDGYASTPIDLFNVGNGQSDPSSTLTMDAAGNLFTVVSGGPANDGSVIELVRFGGSFTASTIVAFGGTDGKNPEGKLIADALGNLYGVTASGGANNKGAIFEIGKSGNTYYGPLLLASFDGTNGNEPSAGGLVMDSAGDLFGTTVSGGANGEGTIFEVAKGNGFATALYSFAGTNGLGASFSSLIMDSAGDLFGMTAQSANGGGGAVVELARTANGYSNVLTTLAYFTDGDGPSGNLVMDSAGNLFGATRAGGAYGDGTVFEIVKTASGYSNTLVTLASFDNANGAIPTGDLLLDSDGNLIGMTEVGGANGAGVIFKIPARPPQAITTTDVTTTVTNTDPPAPPVVTITSAAEASRTATQTITGTVSSADATVVGRTVTLTDNGTVLDVGTVQSNGSFSVSVTLPNQGSNSIVASVTDSLGFTGTSAAVVDTLDNIAPTVTITSAGGATRHATQTIAGTVVSGGVAAVAGQTVILTDNGVTVATATVQSNGSFSTSVALPNEGTNTIVATVTDSYGNVGASTAVVYTLDDIAPTVTMTSAAEASNIAAQTITGTVASGGAAAIVGQTVTVTDNGVTLGTTTVQSDGSFSLTATLPNQGTNSIVAQVTDSYGNTGTSAAVVDLLDNIPPTVTITSAAEGSRFPNQTITGTVVSGGTAAVVGQTVTLTDNGVLLATATVQSNGTFSASVTLPNQGTNSIVATVADTYSNIGTSAPVVDLLDNIPPTVTLTSAAEQSNNPTQTITGTVVSGGVATVVGRTVTLTDNGVAIGSATVQANGSFSANVTLPNYGTNAIVATLTDSYGNVGSSGAVVDTLALAQAAITGTAAGQLTTSDAPINPFSGVTIADPNIGTTETLTITLSGAGGTLSGTGLSGGGSTYTLSGTAATISSELQALVFTPTAGQPNTTSSTSFALSDTVRVSAPTVLASFSGANGQQPLGGLIEDSAGDLFGTTTRGGGSGTGNVFELVKSGSSYTLSNLYTFASGASDPASTLTMDGAGNLFGTVAGGDGSVFELVKSGSSYTPTTVASFSGSNGNGPEGKLIADASGNLYGETAAGGASNKGTIFEIAKSGNSYSGPIVLASFTGTNGNEPSAGGLVMDSAGNLFGTTATGGANGVGTIFELAKFSGTITTLYSFAGTNGLGAFSTGLIMDAAGDLFGMTATSADGGGGAVVELAKNGSNYSTTLTTLAYFSDGFGPSGNLVMDSAGNLFGATGGGGANGDGTLFEIAKTSGGYSSTPITLTSFNGTNGTDPTGSLIIDAYGNMFGMTQTGGASGDGVIFTLANPVVTTNTATTVTDNDPALPPKVTITSSTVAGRIAAQTVTGTVTSPDAVVAGQTVTLTDNGILLGTGKVQSNGNFSVSVTLPNQGSNSIVASVTDSLGLTGTSSAVVDTLDTVAPTVTITSAAEAGNIAAQTITGTVTSGGAAAVVGQTVTLTDNGVTVGTATVQSNGTFSANVTLANQGSNSIVATVADSYGNTGSSAAVADTLDNVAPTVVITSETAAGNVAAQAITGTVVSGGAAAVVGQTVTLTDNGVTFGTATVQANGSFSASVTLPNQGSNSIVATVTDSYGNTGGSAAVVDTLDTIAPTVTITSPAETSNAAAQTITGTVVSGGAAAVVGQTVTLTDNGVALGTATVQANGSFSANVTLPNQGSNSIVTIVTDSYGNTGNSAAVVDTLDNMSPTVTITSAAGPTKVAAQPITGTVVSNGVAVVAGQTVTLVDNGTTLATAIVQSNGSFSANVTLPNQGSNSIIAVVTDSLGNTGTSAAVVDTLDNVAPTVTITSAAEASKTAAQTITGTVVSGGTAAIVGQTVTLTDNGVALATATVQADGTFSANVRLPNQNSNSIVATVTDSYGNTGISAAVVDTLGSVAPTIAGTHGGQTTTSQAPVNPFTGVTVGDLNVGAIDTLTITLSGAGGTLSGTGLSGSGTTYTLSGTASVITSELDALVFTPASGAPNSSGRTTVKLSDGSSGYTTAATYAAATTLLASFNAGSNGNDPIAGLIMDAAGNLFGTTPSGGANNGGEVFEIVKTGSSYSSTPSVLVSFNNTNGQAPYGGLIMDAAGNLFGTTEGGGANRDGTVFEIVKSGSSYSSSPTTIATLSSTTGIYPVGSLIMDAAGNLIGTTSSGGTNSDGTIFEIVKNGSSYSSTPTVLVTFNGTNGAGPVDSLLTDAAGNLFGTTSSGGANNDGVVFEIVKSGGSYSSTPTILASFSGTNGANPHGNLVADAVGDLFGTTLNGGANNKGTVFELVKSGSSYGAPTVLASFNGTNGANPQNGLIIDAAGNLFGAASGGGANNYGTLFEIANNGGSYGALTVLSSLTYAGGGYPDGNLSLDAAGDLIGTASSGGAGGGGGAVIELAGTQATFIPTVDSTTTVTNTIPPVPPTVTITSTAGGVNTAAQTITGTVTTDAVVAGQTVTLTDNGTVLGSGTVQSNGTFSINVTLPNVGANSIVASVTDSLGITGNSAAIVDTLRVAPTITGTHAGQTTTSQAPVNPFTGVTIGDANSGATDTLAITLSGAGGALSGTGLSGSGTTYTLSGTASVITSELDALVFTPTAGAPNTSGTTTFKLSDGSSAYLTPLTYASTPAVLTSFNNTNGLHPYAGVIMDASGNLFGTTQNGGAYGVGEVFELAKSGNTYSSTPTVMGSFTSSWGSYAEGGLVMDAAGNLFGTAFQGGANGDGIVYELFKNGSTYGGPSFIATFNGANGQNPRGNLIVDAAGNLFGTTFDGGANGKGNVFEIAKSGSSYSGTPISLASFNGTNGWQPNNGLVMDSAGNLFGTTTMGGANGDGEVFEIAKTGSTYSSTPTVLVSFSGSNGNGPYSNLIMDASGNLFGTTSQGGANNDGTVFEIVNNGGSYSSAPIVLASFNGTNGTSPIGGLVMDAAGDLFGSTSSGGAGGYGTLFEIAKSGSGYSSALTVLSSFTNANGSSPEAGLFIDSAGDLFGTTYNGGANSDGEVFELVATPATPIPTLDSTTTVINSTPPAPPTVTITSAAVAGKTAAQTITGTVTSVDAMVAGQTVTLMDNGTVVGTGTVQSNGSFSVAITLANQGSNAIVASVTDSLGVAGASAAVVDTLDTIAPSLVIGTPPVPGNTSAQTASGNVVSGGAAAVAGRTVIWTDNGVSVGTATVQSNGSFSGTVTLPSQANNAILASVADSYGNTNNTYLATTGSGHVAITAAQSVGTENDLDFTGGLTDQNLWFLQSGNNLQIDVLGSSTDVTVNNWFAGSANQLQEIVAGGLKLDSQVSQLVQAMATYSAGHPGFDPSSPSISTLPSDTNLQSSIGAAWHS
ncbi:hypothetical protein IVB14_32120 [Bradyrhizobium sp. 180]|uniref:beta strand repeat-containing protein n=1 Tax=Bradyrhizobium sp. 180 TaxID=2782650 RepID=UPI001FF71BA2|nr:choice-of-anchor tandem repeat GloVer-containing protein [Bradyrhizobium sp. 180]MCK1494931.1 hypothetical protein [Bradyrhizobium sp. 180]